MLVAVKDFDDRGRHPAARGGHVAQEYVFVEAGRGIAAGVIGAARGRYGDAWSACRAAGVTHAADRTDAARRARAVRPAAAEAGMPSALRRTREPGGALPARI